MNGLQGHDARVFDIVSQRCYILCLDGEAQPEKHWRLWNTGSPGWLPAFDHWFVVA